MAPKDCDSLEEVSSSELTEVISELRELKINIKKCDRQLKTIEENLDQNAVDTETDEFATIEEPSSYTCEQRGYGKFSCECGREWGSSFSYTGYGQSCFKCGADVIPTSVKPIVYNNKQKNKKRQKQYWKKPFSHSYQYCEACKLSQCAWRPENHRTKIRVFTTRQRG